MAQENKRITIEDASLIWCNFEGAQKPFNDKGDRNFTVKLDDDIADRLLADGWNVKRSKPREGDEEQITFAYLTVAVRFDNIPPQVYMITHRGKTPLDEELVGLLDTADILKADLIINPSKWTVQGKSGIKAYLSTAYVTINETELDLKYADLDYAVSPTRSSERSPVDPGGAPF